MAEALYSQATPWLTGAAIVAAALVVSCLLHWAVFAALLRVVRRTPSAVDEVMLRHARRPMRAVVIVLALIAVVPMLALPEADSDAVARVLSILLTVAIGWTAFSVTRTLRDIVGSRYDLAVSDNLRAREVHTRMRLIQRILGVVIVLVTVSIVLMSIPSIRQIGVTLFASAGIAGIVAGFAARPVLSNLLAGIQIALTQPIRIDDVVIVEGEWGWVEEIRMTFVVVRIWDLRRMVVPLTYFIETPFQNWTRINADIIGSVFLHTDYSVPVERLRSELNRILQESPLWDGKVANLQVTNTSERTMELRALMSARNSPEAWDLRCSVRERLIDFVQREYPDALPRLRAEVVGGDRPDGGAARTVG